MCCVTGTYFKLVDFKHAAETRSHILQCYGFLDFRASKSHNSPPPAGAGGVLRGEPFRIESQNTSRQGAYTQSPKTLLGPIRESFARMLLPRLMDRSSLLMFNLPPKIFQDPPYRDPIKISPKTHYKIMAPNY